ncbi:MAG: phosphatidylserine decarboxylase [Myxococcales bacterium]|nr:phosphatidylserine decarboxylase [Myxococcales bacterium]MCB9714321.1 phosphatidylserine decarboxylase [Myxococcales bacterium]
MSARPPWLARLAQQEDLNFLLTNRIPRRQLTLLMGWFSRLEHPWVRDLSLWAWRRLAPDLDLSDARKSRFRSLHDCFTRELRPGARPIDLDPEVIVSPCDGLVGAHGRVEGTRLYQVKGFPYSLDDLLPDPELVAHHADGWYVTLRLRSTFYHRFHAPVAGRVREVQYVSGDTWNVNPIALRRVERLFCKNERAVIPIEPARPGVRLTLVPVAAICVASLRLHFLARTLDLRHRGPNRFVCDVSVAKGDELGYFQHGSTILVFARGNVEFAPQIREGQLVRVGQPLFRRRR